MFDRIKKAFGKEARPADESEGQSSRHSPGSLPEWAATHGFAFSVDGSGHGIALDGKVGSKPWRLQLGRATRDYIRGEEVRARAELGLLDDVAVVVMSRPLKEALEKKAYQIYTDDLQTSLDSSMPEEMRWLAIFEEVGWNELPPDFWARYCVLSDRRENALAWVDLSLARLMVDWPAGTSAEVPFMILLLRGKAYLRMEYTPADLATLQHAALVFTTACEAGLGAFDAKKQAREARPLNRE
ncbi:MAG: hypothetical protein H0X13_05570 [Ramlibacter sp.]|nr:hypothetical protein [Ramlibacter sp.]